jgi:NADH:ubiquinone oxidoreductase subunit H
MLIRIGFFLLIERKILGFIHYRFGPNKVFFLGVMQFLIDFLKLIFKDFIFLNKFNIVNLIVLILIFLFTFFL